VLYAAFFQLILSGMKNPRPDFVDLLPKPPSVLSPAMQDLQVRRKASELTFPAVYLPYTFLNELRHYPRIRYFEPRTPAEHVNLAIAYAPRKPDQALVELQKALSLEPHYSPAHAQWGNVLLAQGRLPEAIAKFREALELNPSDGQAHLGLGTALGMLDAPDEAVVHLRRAVELNTNDAESHANLAVVLLRQGKIDQAVIHIRQALASPSVAKLGRNRAELSRALRELEQRHGEPRP
jgi:tetratricopeptide (TPR) repeat protein